MKSVLMKKRDKVGHLWKLFGSEAKIISESLQYLFDGLLIHKLVYYQSYNQGILEDLIAALNMRSGQRQKLRSKLLNQTSNQQDWLGMTPLRILACSSVHDLELYCVIVKKYPSYLITKDRWGHYHYCMHAGGLHQLRLLSSYLELLITFPLSYIQLDNDGGDNGED